MLPSFLVTFRETLEAALIVGIVLGYVKKTNQIKYNRVIYSGITLAIFASIFGAILFTKLVDGFAGRTGEIFEGITMLIGALLLTTMILWLMKQKSIAGRVRDKLESQISSGYKLGLFSLVFISVFREGVETVIFLGAVGFAFQNNNLFGALIGILAAILLGILIFIGSLRINLKTFFNITNLFLILLASGLVARGIHELQGARILPIFVEHVWDVNRYALLRDTGYIGSILKDLFGYNGDPSLLELVGYSSNLIGIFVMWKYIRESARLEIS